MKTLSLTTLLLSTALAGCVNHNAPLNETYGEAVRNNMAAQIIDPAPAEGDVVSDGNNAVAAIERYHTGEVKESKAPKSSDLDTSSTGE